MKASAAAMVALLFATPKGVTRTTAPDAPDAIDSYIAHEMARQHIPGLALGIYVNGKIVRAQGYGLSNVELDVPVKPATIFQSGSVGKQFTSAAIMMLVEEGKIELDDSLPKYFLDSPPSWRGITIRELLSHTSGLSEYASDSLTGPGGPLSYRADYTEEQFVKVIETLPIEFAPGEGWEYRNTNYLLLGAVIRKVTGKFYGDFLQERIFRPLGMTSTRVISEADIVPNRAAGYQLVGGKLRNQDWVAPMWNTTADGALYFNVLDLSKWDAALYGEKLLHKSSFDQLWTVVKLKDGTPNKHHYGFGWGIDSVNGHRVIEHSGSWQGFETHIARYVDDRVTVAVLMNLGGANPTRIAHGVAGLFRRGLSTPADTAGF